MTKRLTLLIVPLVALAVAACGSSSKKTNTSAAAPPASTTTNTAPAGQAGTVPIAANPSGMLMFTHNKLSTHAGKVTIAFTNSSSVARCRPHQL